MISAAITTERRRRRACLVARGGRRVRHPSPTREPLALLKWRMKGTGCRWRAPSTDAADKRPSTAPADEPGAAVAVLGAEASPAARLDGHDLTEAAVVREQRGGGVWDPSWAMDGADHHGVPTRYRSGAMAWRSRTSTAWQCAGGAAGRAGAAPALCGRAGKTAPSAWSRVKISHIVVLGGGTSNASGPGVEGGA